MRLGTDRQRASHERRDAIYFICEYVCQRPGHDAAALLFETLAAQLDIHFGGGEAWGEGCCLMEAIGATGSAQAIQTLEGIDLARDGAANVFTVDLEDGRQAAIKALKQRLGADDAA